MPVQKEDRDPQWPLDQACSKHVVAERATITMDQGCGIRGGTSNSETVVKGDIRASGAAVAMTAKAVPSVPGIGGTDMAAVPRARSGLVEAARRPGDADSPTGGDPGPGGMPDLDAAGEAFVDLYRGGWLALAVAICRSR